MAACAWLRLLRTGEPWHIGEAASSSPVLPPLRAGHSPWPSFEEMRRQRTVSAVMVPSPQSPVPSAQSPLKAVRLVNRRTLLRSDVSSRFPSPHKVSSYCLISDSLPTWLSHRRLYRPVATLLWYRG